MYHSEYCPFGLHAGTEYSPQHTKIPNFASVNHWGVGRESMEGQVGLYCWQKSGVDRRRRRIVTRDTGRVTRKIGTRKIGTRDAGQAESGRGTRDT
jgi:hypothetical protein